MNRAMSLIFQDLRVVAFGFATGVFVSAGSASVGSTRSPKECFEDLKTARGVCEKLVKGDQQDVQMAMCMFKELKKKPSDCDQFYKDKCEFDKSGKAHCKIEPEATVKKPAATR